MASPYIYEFIVLKQEDATIDLLPLLTAYDQEAQSVNGFISSRHYRSFYALPEADATPVYVMIYQWQERDTIARAAQHIVSTTALANLLASANIVAFALTEQTEGDGLMVNTLANKSEHVLEVAVRRVKANQESLFETHRHAFVKNLTTFSAVIASYEFRAVLGDNPEGLSVGLTVYENQLEFQTLASKILPETTTTQYFATFDIEALKYVHPL